ncbi:hypothetical protein [Pedobacter xixiisoli]|uniref:Uncharacterized protein n=1 Tax=Pedobacter xixiisoli TaxID=1476464 RepID=A0A285ZZW8_9SPHI|nr:hypothetical protein [Pedobacter xixiisoli]SOD15151.1 hypothetical protein SAMN06297358_2127 [Pedobacter xixiisoli]
MENASTNHPKKEQGADMEALNEFDQNHFYESDHISDDMLSEKDRSSEELTSQEISGTASLADRIAEEQQSQKKEIHTPKENTDLPTAEDGRKLMDVGRAPDS